MGIAFSCTVVTDIWSFNIGSKHILYWNAVLVAFNLQLNHFFSHCTEFVNGHLVVSIGLLAVIGTVNQLLKQNLPRKLRICQCLSISVFVCPLAGLHKKFQTIFVKHCRIMLCSCWKNPSNYGVDSTQSWWLPPILDSWGLTLAYVGLCISILSIF